jgi:SAM-dependent methyltransferase
MMDLNDLINRTSPSAPWSEGDNIPWHEPGFSHRMLKEHLSQSHNAASRRFEIIDRQVEWIHHGLLSGQPSRILDLGCGPGFYDERLARFGHTCFGIDYSPASIEYAISTAQREQLSCQFTRQDIRLAEYPQGVDLVMLIYGEFNVFRPVDAAEILDKAWQALKQGGILLLEPHTFRMVKHLGNRADSWYSSQAGLFFDGPHIVLQENSWDDHSQTATIRYYVVQPAGGRVTPYAQSFQAYSDKDYRSLLNKHGFRNIHLRKSISDEDPQKGLIAIIAYK